MSALLQPEPPSDVALERHYTIVEIAKRFNLSYASTQHLFENEPGVLKIVREGSATKRRYTIIRVPESVVIRVHRRMRPA